MLAFRAHITTEVGRSLHIGVLASTHGQATALIDQAAPGNRGAQLRNIRRPLRLIAATPLHPNGSRCRAEAANQAPEQPNLRELPNPLAALQP